eukprot:Skav203676  [mRNA]  locus=scaffold259:59299:61245:+ [translate_table: standard]
MQKAKAELSKLETVTRSLISCIECPICMETMTEAASGCCGLACREYLGDLGMTSMDVTKFENIRSEVAGSA